jgi:hypothetical protein
MKVFILKKAIFDDKLGRLMHGQVVDLPEHKAQFYIARGDAELYETKVFRENPYKAVGETKPLSASPAVLVLPEQTLSASDSGVKRKARTKKEL